MLLFVCMCVCVWEDSEDCADDEICDTYVIEQTDKGFRCAIDVPSVLYKYVTLLSPYIIPRGLE